ncbi:hypothetical protein HOY80DRAFT_1020783 [Tuber brumale]|nr:hypothetical protein HOY80DRAFT_1020783 [Tuber brumale]
MAAALFNLLLSYWYSESGSSGHNSGTDTSANDLSRNYSYQGSDKVQDPQSSLQVYDPVQFAGLIQASDNPSSTSQPTRWHPIQCPIIATANPTKRNRPSSWTLSTSHNYPTFPSSGYTSSASASSTCTDTDSKHETLNQPPHIPTIFHTGAEHGPPDHRFLLNSHRPLPFTRAHLLARLTPRASVRHWDLPPEPLPRHMRTVPHHPRPSERPYCSAQIYSCTRRLLHSARLHTSPVAGGQGCIAAGRRTALLGVAAAGIQGLEVSSSVHAGRAGWRVNEWR